MAQLSLEFPGCHVINFFVCGVISHGRGSRVQVIYPSALVKVAIIQADGKGMVTLIKTNQVI